MVICLERSANDLHMVQLIPMPPHHLCFSKFQNGLSFWYRSTHVVLEKRPLNDCGGGGSSLTSLTTLPVVNGDVHKVLK